MATSRKSPTKALCEGGGKLPKPSKLDAEKLTPSAPVKGPAYFPSIERQYGRPIGEWQQIVRGRLPAKHMDLVSMLKGEHGMGHGHANAIVAHVLATEKS